jgi:hypothetical protein
MVSISFGHGFLEDCDDATGWVETEDGNTCALSVVEGDFFDLNVTASAGNAVAYYSYPDEGGASNLGLSTGTYMKIRYRYMTSNANVKAKIMLVFNDASTQEILVDTSSTSLTSATVAITASKTIDHVRLYADAAVGHVYYDFVLIYKNDFTFPNIAGGMEFSPPPKFARLEIPARISDISQGLGANSAFWNLDCDLSIGTWTRAGDTIAGQIFYEISHNPYNEPFEWFDSEIEQCKVTVENPVFVRRAHENGIEKILSLTLREYRLSNAGCSLETYVTRLGLDL